MKVKSLEPTLIDTYRQQRGVYARVALSLGVHPSYVSRVASGQRTAPQVLEAILAELADTNGARK